MINIGANHKISYFLTSLEKQSGLIGMLATILLFYDWVKAGYVKVKISCKAICLQTPRTPSGSPQTLSGLLFQIRPADLWLRLWKHQVFCQTFQRKLTHLVMLEHKKVLTISIYTIHLSRFHLASIALLHRMHAANLLL